MTNTQLAPLNDRVIQTTLTPEYLAELGLKPEDSATVVSLANSIDVTNDDVIGRFGGDAAKHTVEYADRMLGMISLNDLGEATHGLKTILSKAKEINVNLERSRIPIVGRFIDRTRNRIGGLVAGFQTAREAIDATMGQVEQTRQSLQESNRGLEEAYHMIRQEFIELGKHIGAGKLAQQRLSQEISVLEAGSLGPLDVQTVADYRAKQDRWAKRVADLTVLQQHALTTLPSIRLIQANNNLLIEKYTTIATLTIPTWKRQMMLGLALDEQVRAVELGDNVDKFTNALIRRQAEVVHKTSIATAKSNQRLVIDVETVSYTQNLMIQTLEEVMKIQSEAQGKREEAERQIQQLRQEQHQLVLNHDKNSATLQ